MVGEVSAVPVCRGRKFRSEGKAVLGAAATAGLALMVGEPLPGADAALSLLAIGATGYGLSLRLYLLAQRAFGAAGTCQ